MLEFHQNTHPYPGLRPFESWEEEIFFGRQEHTNRLLDILQQQRFLAVIGPSGSGKSSLVRAGLLPALPLGFIGTGSDWKIAIMRPGHQPIQRLAQTLLSRSALGIELVGEDYLPENDKTPTSEVAMVAAELRRGPLGLIQVVKNARARLKDKEAFNLLVLVDQFEEIFTYADAGGSQADESEAFVNLLLASRLAKELQIFVVLTMRTDFLGNCVRFLELPDAINRAQYLTPRLTREQIQSAITGPAQVFEGNVEPTLVAELINAVSDDPDQLPILQHALARMWDLAVERDPEHKIINWNDFNHEKIGGIANALSGHADEILALLSPHHKIEEPLSPAQQTAEILFRAITDQRSAEEGGQAVRRPQTLQRIAQWSGKEWQDFKPVLDEYTKEGVNFLRTNATLGKNSKDYIFDKETEVDISHEALIRQWKRLQEWVAQEVRFASEYKRLLDRTLDWQDAEQKKKGSGSLLTGADLARALEWQQGQYGNQKTDTGWTPNTLWADRYGKLKDDTQESEFEDVTKYIEESNALLLRTEKRESLVKNTLIGALIVSIGCLLIAAGFAIKFRTVQTETSVALLWNSLNFSSDEINNVQAGLLLKLSEYDETKKEIFIDHLWNESHFDQFLTKETLATNFNHKPDAIIRALVSLNTKRRNELINRFIKAPHGQDTHDLFLINRALALIELESDAPTSVMLDAIGTKFAEQDVYGRNLVYEALVKKIEKLSDSELLTLADQLIEAVLSPVRVYRDFNSAWEKLADKSSSQNLTVVVDNLLMAMKNTDIPQILDGLSSDLPIMCAKVSSKDAEAVFNKLFTAIETAKDVKKPYYYAGLAAVAEQIPASHADAALGKLIAAMKEADSGQRNNFVEPLAAVAKKAPEEQLMFTVNYFFEAMGTAKEPDKPYYYSEGIAALAEQVPGGQAEATLDKLIAAMKKATDSDYTQRENLAKALAAVAKKAQAARVTAIFNQIFETMNTAQEPATASYRAILTALAEHIPSTQAGSYIGKLITLMKNTKDSNQRENFSKVLTALTEKKAVNQAVAVTGQSLDIEKNAKEPDRPEDSNARLPDVAQKVPEEQAIAVIDKLIAAMKSAKDFTQRESLEKALAAATKQVTDKQAVAAVDQLLDAAKNAKEPDRPEYYIAILPDLVERVSEAQTAAEVIDMLIAAMNDDKYTHQREDLAKALATVAKKAPEVRVTALFNQLFEAMGTAKEPNKANNSAVLVILAEHIPSTQAEAVIGKLIATMKNAEYYYYRDDFSNVLAAVTKHVPNEKAVAVVDQLLDAAKNAKEPDRPEYFSARLPDVTEKVLEAQAAVAIDKLIAAMKGVKEDSVHRDDLIKALATLAKKAPETKAVLIATEFMEAIKNPQNESLLETLGEALEKSMQKAPRSQVSVLVNKLILEMKETIQNSTLKRLIENQQKTPRIDTAELTKKVLEFTRGDYNQKPQLKALSRGLVGIASKIAEPEAEQHFQKLFGLIQNNTDIGQIEALSGSIVTLSTGLTPDMAAKWLFKALANPLTPRDDLADAIRARFPDEPRITKDKGYWELISWGTNKGFINE